MYADQNLLTDEQMRQFIAHGYLILKTDFPPGFHDALNARIDEVMDSEGNPGNNFLPRIPEAQEVFQHPVIRGGLTSILGTDYIMHPHRHCHYTYPGRKVQSWHKDSYWGYQKVRNHHPWWAMIFYYPHGVDQLLGPSALMPGTQYYDKRAGDETEEEVLMEGAAGTFALIHYDVWHRGSANNSQRTRAMMKFQFVRLTAPTTPTWQFNGTGWRPPNGDGPPTTHEAIWRHQWNWLSGQPSAPVEPLDSEDDVPNLQQTLASSYEPEGMDAAYRLGALGGVAIDALQDGLRSDNIHANRRAGYGLVAAGPDALDGLVEALSHVSEKSRGYAAFALGELGAGESAAGIAGLIDDESEWVRYTAAEALGILDNTDVAVPALSRGLEDGCDQVRFTSALSLTRIGAPAEASVPALTVALQDDNRYVRANAVEALRSIGTPAALDAALKHLIDSRWCYTTTTDNPF